MFQHYVEEKSTILQFWQPSFFEISFSSKVVFCHIVQLHGTNELGPKRVSLWTHTEKLCNITAALIHYSFLLKLLQARQNIISKLGMNIFKVSSLKQLHVASVWQRGLEAHRARSRDNPSLLASTGNLGQFKLELTSGVAAPLLWQRKLKFSPCAVGTFNGGSFPLKTLKLHCGRCNVPASGPVLAMYSEPSYHKQV